VTGIAIVPLLSIAGLWAMEGGPASSPGGGEQGRLLALEQGRVTVLYAPGDSVRARAYLDFLLDLPTLPGLPDSIPSGVQAYLAPDQVAFDSLVGGRVPEWSAGVAVPSRRMLVLPAWQSSLTGPGAARRVLTHEWAHLGLHQWLDPLRVPRWFSEGYAEWVGGWDATEGWRLRIMLAMGRAPPLDSLSFRWPADRASADVAYLLSATVIEYLVDESGERGLAVLLRRWKDGGSFEDALRSTYGVTSGQLEEDWREWAKARYGWLYVLSHSAVFWLLLTLALLVMVRVRRRRNRERLARLRAEEPPDRPAYWMGEDTT
jgi:hypothetical protein